MTATADEEELEAAADKAGAIGSSRRFRSISEEVADSLRDMVLVGQLRPGQNVTQEDLASRLGVSTMPVREALLRLSHEGFIEARRGRSFLVVHTTIKDVSDIYWLQATIERELTKHACHQADHVIAELEACAQEWRGAVDTGHPDRLEKLNFRFHRTINQAAESPVLVRQLRHTLRSIPQHFYSLLPEWIELSTAGHEEILAAMQLGDADAAGEAASRHILDTGRLLIAYFNETGFWTPPVRRV